MKYFKTQQNVYNHTKDKIVFVVSCITKEINKCHNSLELNKVTDCKTFWKAIKPLLFDKETNINNITLKNNDKVISDGKQRWRL